MHIAEYKMFTLFQAGFNHEITSRSSDAVKLTLRDAKIDLTMSLYLYRVLYTYMLSLIKIVAIDFPLISQGLPLV